MSEIQRIFCFECKVLMEHEVIEGLMTYDNTKYYKCPICKKIVINQNG